MEEFLTRVWEMLIGRTTGPLTLRLNLQPTVATILAIRAGLRDTRQGRIPYFRSIVLHPAHRHDLIRRVCLS